MEIFILLLVNENVKFCLFYVVCEIEIWNVNKNIRNKVFKILSLFLKFKDK